MNAVPIEPDCAATLTRPPLGGEDDETVAASLRRTWDVAESGAIGPELQELCGQSRPLLSRIIELAHSLSAPIAAMPRALVCNEIGFGYAPGENTPLAFDWHGLYVGPRFDAMKHLFGTPEGVRNGWGVRFEPLDEYAAYYVEALNRVCGTSVTTADVLRETRQLWLRDQFVQDWWVSRAQNGDTIDANVSGEDRALQEAQREETRRDKRTDLLSIFGYIIAQVQE